MNITSSSIQQTLNLLTGNQNGSIFVDANETQGQSFKLGTNVSLTINSRINHNTFSATMAGAKNIIVKSDLPLTAKEIIHGKVVGVGDKVEIQRVISEKIASDSKDTSVKTWATLNKSGSAGQYASQLLNSYQVKLTAGEQSELASFLKQKLDNAPVVLSALVLAKIGITVNRESLSLVYPALSDKYAEKFRLQKNAAEITYNNSPDGFVTKETVTDLSGFISTLFMEMRESDIRKHAYENMRKNEINMDSPDKNSAAQQDVASDDESKFYDNKKILFNSQNDGAVSHQVSVVPFFINDQLIEVNVAMFSQKQSDTKPDSVRYKRIVISLDLDMLGHTEIELKFYNKHASISIVSENKLAENELVAHMPLLKEKFSEFQITIDELSYGMAAKNPVDNVINSIVTHYISQDSLNRNY